MRKIAEIDYLYEHDGRYLIRMQVPAALRKTVGKRELKAALGPDRTAACRNSHKVIAEFDLVIARARAHAVETTVIAPSEGALSHHDIDLGVHAHFRRMTVQLRGKTVADRNDPDPRSRAGRIRGYASHIELMLNAIDDGRYEIVATAAQWLCEEYGWIIDPASAAFKHLCERMLSARLACYQAEMSLLKRGFSPVDELDPFFRSNPPSEPERGRCLGDLIDKFNRERSDAWSTSTKKNYIIITRVIEEVCGRDTPLSAIDKDYCRSVRDVLKRLPSNYQKKAATRGRSIAEAMEIAAVLQMPLLQPATINAHLIKFGAIIRFGRDEGWVLGNPMADIEVNDPVDASEKRDPFNLDQLTAIFHSEPWASPAEKTGEKPSRFWVPLLALFSGARLGEICGLRTDEIVDRDCIPVIHVRDRPDRHTKGRKSRFIPVHSTLVELGFIAFVEERRKLGSAMLFPEQKSNSLDHWGDDVSDWFKRLVKRLGLEGRKLTMHSFRHSFEDALREADLHDTPLGNALTGRRTGGVSRDYGKGFSTSRLSAAVERVQYPGLSLAHLSVEKQSLVGSPSSLPDDQDGM